MQSFQSFQNVLLKLAVILKTFTNIDYFLVGIYYSLTIMTGRQGLQRRQRRSHAQFALKAPSYVYCFISLIKHCVHCFFSLL